MTRMRVKIRTETLASGVRVERRKLVEAPVLEWKQQAASVRAVRALPGYGDEWASDVQFTLAGDMNSAKRGPQEQVKAKATGLAPGEPDLRLLFIGARLKMIEYKAEKGRLSPEQKKRHVLLRGLGFDVVVVQTKTEEEAAAATVALVKAWLGEPANDN